ncbi:hypothetical protein N824_18830 [Pedobacter sp. V48]|nr:hypothetical protein N824_18830 [Pedobacter sp. V48]
MLQFPLLFDSSLKICFFQLRFQKFYILAVNVTEIVNEESVKVLIWDKIKKRGCSR